MDGSITSRLTQPTRHVMELFEKHKTQSGVRRADSKLTEEQIYDARAELCYVLGIFGGSPKEVVRQAIAKIKRETMQKKLPKVPADSSYQLKITLRGTRPPIWRRFVVPAFINLEQLHAVVQTVMGWTDSHLHAFQIDDERYVGRSPSGEPLDIDGPDEAQFRLCDGLLREKSKFFYQYDFGDSWQHQLVVEKILPAVEKPESFLCLAGAGACPPEDCGGLPGYYNLLDILKHPNTSEYEEQIEWLGGEFDPDELDLDEINKALGWFRKNCRAPKT